MTSEPITVVHYAEGQGDAARIALHTFMHGLDVQPGFLSADLLVSSDQPDLTLVASRWQGAAPALTVPPGVRAWVFRVATFIAAD